MRVDASIAVAVGAVVKGAIHGSAVGSDPLTQGLVRWFDLDSP
jgi:hypothetical protein